MKRYKICDPRDGSDVLGGPVTEGNAYIAAYPRPEPGQKHPRELEVGERSRCVYALSGGRGVYLVFRIEDSDAEVHAGGPENCPS